MADETNPEFDRVEGAPHPRETQHLFGQQTAEAAFLAAYNGSRLHHGWLVTGPRGVGKATLAWRIARFLLAEDPAGGLFAAPPPGTLDVPADHPVSRRVLALSEPRLKLIRRDWDADDKKLDTVITKKRIDSLKNFLHLSSADGGRRVVIVDTADDMNPQAANALLKLLEEPPAKVTLLLISHQPFRLLPTIRSRCRELRCAALGPGDMAQALAGAGAETGNVQALAELSGGSVGEAIRLTNLGGIRIYADIISLFVATRGSARPRLHRPRALELAESAVGKANEPRFDLILRLLEQFMARAARTGLFLPPPEAANGEAAVLTLLSPDADAARTWASLQQTLGARARTGKAVNLDPAALLLDMVLRMDEVASTLPTR